MAWIVIAIAAPVLLLIVMGLIAYDELAPDDVDSPFL